MFHAIFYTWLLLLTSFISPVNAQSLPQEEENAIREVIDNYYSAWNQHDTKRMASYYAPDGDIRTPWNEMGKNRKEVEAIIEAQHVKKLKNAKVDHTISSVRMIKPDIAFVDVESTITGMQTQDEKQYAPLNHHVVYLMVKRNGKWQVISGRPF